MANEARLRQLALGGLVEDNPLTSGATTLTSGALAAVSGGVGSTQYLAIVIDPDGNDGAPEIVHVTALTGGAGSATIARGREGTTARQHDAGTPWVHAVTPYDVPITVDQPWGGDLGYDYEFDGIGSTLPSGWSWVNQGGAVYNEQFGAGAISVSETSAWNWRMITRAFPAGTWTATAKVCVNNRASNTAAGTLYAGLILRESSSGKQLSFGYSNEIMSLYVLRWSSATTEAATVGSTYNHGPATAWYLRIRRNSSTSYDYEMSADGRVFVPIVSANDPTANLTPDQIGFGVANNSGVMAGISCEWFRVR